MRSGGLTRKPKTKNQKPETMKIELIIGQSYFVKALPSAPGVISLGGVATLKTVFSDGTAQMQGAGDRFTVSIDRLFHF